MNNKKMVYLKNRLINTLAKNCFLPTTAKAYEPYTPDKEEYYRTFASFDYQQNIAKYKSEGLPYGLTSERLESMLYFRGALLGFVENETAYILPFTACDGLNCYGLMTEGQPIPYTTKYMKGVPSKFSKHRIYFNFETMLPTDAIILFDSAPYLEQPIPQAVQNKVIIENIVETMIKVNCNLVISNKKLLLRVDNEAQADVAKVELNNIFGCDSPFGVVVADTDIQSIGDTIDFNADAFFNAMASYDALRCMFSGIQTKSYGLNKAERINSGELNGIEEQIDLKYNYGLYLRQEFAKNFNKLCELNGIKSDLKFSKAVEDKSEGIIDEAIDEGIERNESEVIENE